MHSSRCRAIRLCDGSCVLIAICCGDVILRLSVIHINVSETDGTSNELRENKTSLESSNAITMFDVS
jgi:hypothetical protein